MDNIRRRSRISPSRSRSHDIHSYLNLQQDLGDKGMTNHMCSIPSYDTPEQKGNLQLCQNYRTTNLISHPSEVILKILLNRLQPQIEEISAAEQVGFKAGRSTTEYLFNLRMLCEKYLQHQKNLYHVFIDFKKAVDKVLHETLWATMK